MPESSIGKKLRKALRLPAPSAPPPAAGTGLLAHSELEFDLQQGVVLRALTGSTDPKGVCLALSGAWLKEKRTRTNGSFSAALDLVGLDRKFHVTNVTEDREKKIVTAATERQNAYEKSGGTANDRLDRLLRESGMRYDPGLSAAMEDCVRQHPDPGDWRPVTDIALTFTSATSDACLPEGRGVCIAVDVDGRGHAVAAYRSRGGSLHFFDPNLGVFKVGNPAGFFAEWVARYAASGKTLAVTPKGTPENATEPRTFTCVR
ncbi:MAG: YopT-type cysteine protease domain-containing protein [Janthinobacterium lividum]